MGNLVTLNPSRAEPSGTWTLGRFFCTAARAYEQSKLLHIFRLSTVEMTFRQHQSKRQPLTSTPLLLVNSLLGSAELVDVLPDPLAARLWVVVKDGVTLVVLQSKCTRIASACGNP